MNLQAKMMASLFLILAVLASFFATYKYGRHVEYLVQDNLRKEAIIKATKDNDNLKLLLQVERQNAENALNILLARKPDRLRLPTCPSQTGSTGGSAVPATGTQRATDEFQKSFEVFTDGLELDAIAWSRAIEACRVTMEWARAQ